MVQDPAHDLAHIKRVFSWSKKIAIAENARLDVVLPAAIFHDIVNLPKDHSDRRSASTLSAQKAVGILRELDYSPEVLDDISHVIAAHSYSAGIEARLPEAFVLRDADRLDALGAVGIARCFAVSGAMGRILFSAEDPFCESRKPDDMKFALDHFYTKLLKLEETFHTKTARAEAIRRKQVMLQYLDQLKLEIKIS